MEKINLENLSYSELVSLSKEVNKSLNQKKEERIINLKHKLRDALEAIKEIDCFYTLIDNSNYTLDVDDLLCYINFD